MVWVKRLALVLALVFLYVSVVNASWMAPSPRGGVELIARGGAAQLPPWGAEGKCAAGIEPPLHSFLPDTLPGIMEAARLRTQMTEIHVRRSRDGQLVLFPDAALDCRTNGKGRVADHSLEELKALDAGHGYTADGGKTYPLRGTGTGAIPTLAEILERRPLSLLYDLGNGGPDLADALAAELAASGRDVAAKGDAFRGTPAALDRLRAKYPKAWMWGEAGAEACTNAYLWQGWLGVTPEACRGQTLVIPLNRTWAYAGWPDRLIARMEQAGARIVVTAAPNPDGSPRGLDLPEQIGDIARSYNGYVWVEDISTIAPALRPDFNRRTPEEDAAYDTRWQERRKARE